MALRFRSCFRRPYDRRLCDVWPGEVATWSEEQDRVLLGWVRLRGRKWKELSRCVGALAAFSAAELKTGYLLLEQAERGALVEEVQRLLGESGDGLPGVMADFVADIGEDEEGVVSHHW